MQRIRRTFVRAVVPVVAIALLSTACSGGSQFSRSASGASADPLQVPALPAGPVVPEGTPASPVFPAAVVSANRGVSTSISPTIVADGAKGATTFEIRDLSTGSSGFRRNYSSSGPSQRIPQGAGLKDGGVYVWTATDSTGAKFGGSFQVDLTVSGVQAVDTVSNVSTGLSSGQASFGWESHAMNSLAGAVGFGLAYAVSNQPEAGLPAGWDLMAASSSPYSRLVVREDGSVALYALDGASTIYRSGAGDAFNPVVLSGDVTGSGSAPVLTHNADGTWTVLNKQSASTFSAEGTNGVADLISVDASSKPMLGQKWSDGLLRSITDPVSGRSVEFVYGGGQCGSTGTGFISAPAGMLCRVKFWDGSTSAIWYVAMPDGSAQIGRLVDHPEAKGDGASVTDLAYDSIGRIVTVRSPIVARVIAAGMADANDPSIVSTFAYDDLGRVSSATSQATFVGGPRTVRTYGYESANTTTVADSGYGGVISTVRFDPATFRILATTDTAGLTASNEYDPATGRLIKRVDRNGNVTVNVYDGNQLVETRGPTEGSLATDGTIMRYSYDQTFATSPEGTPFQGLDVSYWSTPDWTGRVTADEIGPTVGGTPAPSLTVNWAESPTGSKEWSARMLGALVVDKEGDYRFTVGGAAKVWIDSVSCVNNDCAALPLSVGTHQVRIDVSTTSPSTSMSVTWAGPDTGGASVSVPLRSLRPQYGYITTTKANDAVAVGASVESVSHTVYEEPSKGQVAARVSQSGAVSKLGYQPLTGSNGNWGRQDSTTMPSGSVVALGYWGDRESSKSACPSASAANQGGLEKSVVMEGAPAGAQPATLTYDAAGRTISSAIAGGATTCTTYDAAGRAVRIENLGMGRTELVVNDYEAGGNPLVSTRTVTTGKEVTVSRLEMDLIGRPVLVRDRNGVEERITYDRRTGEPQRITWTTPSGAATTQVNTYDAVTRLSQIEIDGRAVAKIEYNDDGTQRAVTYGNGVRLALGYDASNRNDSARWTTTDGHTLTSTRTIAPGGRVLASAIAFDGTTSNWQYTYDDARRLASASLSAGLTAARSWAYTYDTNSNRTSQTVDGARSTYTYDANDRLVSSTDPAVGTLEYDALGDVTKLGADTFTYDANRSIVRATDGTTTVDYVRDATGSIVEKTTTSPTGTQVTRYAIGGLTLDADGRPLVQDATLPGGVTYTHPVGAAGTATYGLADLAGNRLATTSDAGAMVGTVQLYEPFGQPLTTPVAAAPGQLDLTWLATTGNESQQLKVPYQLMGARVYVPAIGRFLQVDPQPGGSVNAYDFVNQDPVNLRDANGQSLTDWIATIVVAVVSVALTPFTGGGSILAGMATGLAIGAIGYALDWGIRSAIDGQVRSFDVAQFCIAAGVGAAFGAFGGWLGKFRRSPAEPMAEGSEVAGGSARSSGAGLSAEVVEQKVMTESEKAAELAASEQWYHQALANIDAKATKIEGHIERLLNHPHNPSPGLAASMQPRLDRLNEVYMEIYNLGPERAKHAWQDGLLTNQLRAAGLMK